MRFQVWERSAAPSPRSSRRWRRGYHGRYFSIKSSARCESAPNFDPQPYRCKHLKDKRIDVIMRGQNWTPVKFSESCKFRCCFNWLWLGWGGVKVRRRFTRSLRVPPLRLVVFDPKHYLALLEQKAGALDQAAPLQNWTLPEPLQHLRRLLIPPRPILLRPRFFHPLTGRWCRVTSNWAKRSTRGTKATFAVPAFPNRQFSGTVTQIRPSPQTNEHVATTDIVIRAPNPDLLLKPGMQATIRILIE